MEVSRGKVDLFRRDVDNIRGTFDSWGDSIAATKKQLGALLELDLSGVWEFVDARAGNVAVRHQAAYCVFQRIRST